MGGEQGREENTDVAEATMAGDVRSQLMLENQHCMPPTEWRYLRDDVRAERKEYGRQDEASETLGRA